jgi:hypothetical protein
LCASVVERQWRRPARAASTAAEETNGVESVQWSREQWELREFWDEKQNDTGWATIYRFEHISNDS